MTQPKLSLAALKVAQKQSDQPQFWETLREEQAQQLAAGAEIWMRREGCVAACVATAMALAGLVYAGSEALSGLADERQTLDWMDYLLVPVMIGFITLISALVGALAGIVLVDPFSVAKLRARLSPAKDHPTMCAKLVEQLQAPAVRAFRDTVTGNGRELRFGDLLEMERIAHKERERQNQAERELNCRKLHGIDESSGPIASAGGHA